MKSTVKTPRKAASDQPHASRPTARTGRTTSARWRVASTTRKKVPATKAVMNVDSLVAKLSASSAPSTAGWYLRGRSRNRNATTSMASVIATM